MRKKQVIAIAAALAAVLLMSTAVYAIGNMGAENNQAGNPAEQAALNTAGTEEMEALQTLTAEQVDISEFSVPLGTKAEQILREALVKKPGQQMTEREMERYNNTSDTIKQLTYEEAREKEAEYKAIWDSYQENFADKGWDERNELDPDGERFEALDLYYDYKEYADAIATGVELAKTMYDELKWEAEDSLFFAVKDAANAKLDIEIKFNANKKALAEFYLVVLADIEEELALPDADGDKLVDELRVMWQYWSLQFDVNLGQISPELMAQYTQRYQAGESITEILG